MMEHNDFSGAAWTGQTQKNGQIQYCYNVSVKIESAAKAWGRQRYRPDLRRVANFCHLCQVKRVARTGQ